MNYTPTLGVQSWREITSGVCEQKRLNTTELENNMLVSHHDIMIYVTIWCLTILKDISGKVRIKVSLCLNN
jgi:hypothetical protein